MPVSPATDTKSDSERPSICGKCLHCKLRHPTGLEDVPEIILLCDVFKSSVQHYATFFCERFDPGSQWVPRSKLNTEQWRLIQGDHVLALVERRYDWVQKRDRYMARWCRKGHRVQQVWGDTMAKAARALGDAP